MKHIPVLLDETLRALCPGGHAPQRVIDGTVGGGGHAKTLLAAGAAQLLGIDRDASAIQTASEALRDFGDSARLCHGSYLRMGDFARELGWEAADAILLDLGLSSLQLDEAARGFSFRYDAPLDMRFDASAGKTAHDLVNGLPAEELAGIFHRYGEERHARRIARAIVEARPVQTTGELAELVAAALPRSSRRASQSHPATRVFQALRIAVNDELAAVDAVIPIAVDLLRPGGRLAVISFHSLEDRLVKRALRDMARAVDPVPGMASLGTQRARVKLLSRKPVKPSPAEIARNPRSRSARLRIAEKL